MANAFGSVSHQHVFQTIEEMGLPSPTKRTIQDLYTNTATREVVKDGMTDPIPIGICVKQGYPLSPILFNLAIEPLLKAVRSIRKTTAYKFVRGPSLQLLAYADDLCLVADRPEALQQQLDIAGDVADWCGLQFKAAKCATLHAHCKKKRSVLPTAFEIQADIPRKLLDGEQYRHLGVPTGFRADQSPTETADNLLRDINYIDNSLLAPWQKIDAITTFLTPKARLHQQRRIRSEETATSCGPSPQTQRQEMDEPAAASQRRGSIPEFISSWSRYATNDGNSRHRDGGAEL